MIPISKKGWERFTAKNYHPVTLLFTVSKIFEKFVNNRIVDHIDKCRLFSIFQYGFRSSRSTADLLTVVSDRVARTCIRSGYSSFSTWYIQDLQQTLDARVLPKLKSYEISGQVFDFISFFLSNSFRWLWMRNLHKNIQLMLEFLKGSSLALPVSYYTLMTFVMSLSVIFDIYPDDTTHCSKCDKASDLWQQLELVSKLEPDLQGCVGWGRKWLVDFNAVKTQLVSSWPV